MKPEGYTGSVLFPSGYYDRGSTASFGYNLPATDDASTAVGDPCRYYLGGFWRIPTAAEWSALLGPNGENTDKSIPLKVNGHELYFPAAGTRSASDGTITDYGTLGAYWSSSFYGTGHAYCMGYNTLAGVLPHGISQHQAGLPVRCVQGMVVSHPEDWVSHALGESRTIVVAGCRWTLSKSGNGASALELSRTSGGNGESFTMRWPENFGSARSVVLTVTSEDGTKITINVSQTECVPNVNINGLRWTKGNLVANGNEDCRVGAPTDCGLYFSFGSLVGWKGGANGDGTGQGDPGVAVKVTPEGYHGTMMWPVRYFTDNLSHTGKYDLPATDNAQWAIGDPCRYYLGKPWRTPSSKEFEKLKDLYTPTATMPVKIPGYDLYFPATGWRCKDHAGGLENSDLGYCQSSSVYGVGLETNNYPMKISNKKMDPFVSMRRESAFPVRCVAEHK